MNHLIRLLLVGRLAGPGAALWVALSLLTGCAGLGLELSIPLARRPATGRTQPPDTLHGQVLHLPVVVVRASVRGAVDQFACYAGKRVGRGELLLRVQPRPKGRAQPQPVWEVAPVAGISGPPLVAGNALVAAGAPLVELTDLEHLRLLLTCRGRFARALQAGDEVHVLVGASSVAGTVEQVGSAAVGTVHAGQVLVRLEKPVPRPVPPQTRVVLTRR